MRRSARRTAGLLLLAVLVVGAGCTTGQTADSTPTQSAVAGATPTADVGGSPTTTETAITGTQTSTNDAEDASTTTPATATPTTTDRFPNPWGTQVVTVGLDPDGAQQQTVSPLVNETVNWWNDNRVDLYATYPVTFAYVGQTTDADVVVRFVDELSACGTEWREDQFLGCASVLRPQSLPSDPEVVQIRAGFKREDTLTTLQHEFGHLLGLRHGDDPMFVMNASHVAHTLDRPNATEAAFAWQSRNLTVYFSNDAAAGHRSQVEHALDYFEGGADGTLDITPRFSFTGDREAADVVVELHDSHRDTDVLSDDGSVGTVRGFDDDGDGALEYYSRATITVAGIDNDASGWHVAYWLASALGYTTEELPAVLEDASHDERRSQWWR